MPPLALFLFLMGPALMQPLPAPPPLVPITVPELTIECSSISYLASGSAHKMEVAANLGDFMSLMDPAIGAACNASSGLMTPGAAEEDILNPWQPLWRLNSA